MDVIEYHPGAVKVSFDDLYKEILGRCEGRKIFLYNKFVDMRFIACSFLLRDRELITQYQGGMDFQEDTPDIIRDIQSRVEELTGVEYNYVSVKIYRDWEDGIGFHSDREAKDTIIASLSIGATRRFLVCPKDGKEVTTYYLRSGDLIVMKKGCQPKYKHCIPKMNISDICSHIQEKGYELPKGRKTYKNLIDFIQGKDIVPIRINLTFRL